MKAHAHLPNTDRIGARIGAPIDGRAAYFGEVGRSLEALRPFTARLEGEPEFVVLRS